MIWNGLAHVCASSLAIIVFHFYNTTGCPYKKKLEVVTFNVL